VRCCAGCSRMLILSLKHPACKVYGKFGEHQYIGGVLGERAYLLSHKVHQRGSEYYALEIPYRVLLRHG
jgi:hypothetical protein